MMHPMMGGCGGGGRVELLLITLALGYGVLVLANKQNRPLDVLGRVVGALILAVSFIGLLCVAAGSLCRRFCPMEGGAARCAYMPGKGHACGVPQPQASLPDTDEPKEE